MRSTTVWTGQAPHYSPQNDKSRCNKSGPWGRFLVWGCWVYTAMPCQPWKKSLMVVVVVCVCVCVCVGGGGGTLWGRSTVRQHNWPRRGRGAAKRVKTLTSKRGCCSSTDKQKSGRNTPTKMSSYQNYCLSAHFTTFVGFIKNPGCAAAASPAPRVL